MSDINSRIQRVIAESGLTKTAFAAKLNVSQQHVSRLSEFFGRMLKEDVPYRNEIILCLSRMSPEGWKAVGDKILEIAEEIKKNRIEEE